MARINWKPKYSDLKCGPAPHSIPTPLWEYLYARGYSGDKALDEILNPSLKSLRDPNKIDGMELAVERIVQAFENNETIGVYADFDLDGTSGLALFLRALEGLGFKKFIGYQPKRLSEGYGLHKEAVEKLKGQGVSLILTIDVGITAIEAVDFANSIDIDVIISDHHLPKEVLPAALAVVNPNKGFCTSGMGHLCGAGVAFYIVLALRRTMEAKRLLTKPFNPKELLDCFAIGTLTDMVPLIKENRVLVKHGIRMLENTKRPGLRLLLKELGLWGRPLSGSDVSIRFAPKLNALSRMEEEILPLDLYCVKDEVEAKELVKKMMSINSLRIDRQKKAETLAEDFVKSNPQKGFVFVCSKKYHKGVIGLVATRLCQNHGVPAFVGSIAEGGVISGSARLPNEGFPSLLDAMGHGSEYLNQFGGHAAAAGFELDQDQIQNFENKLEEFYLEFYEKADEAQVDIEYDLLSDLSEVTPEFMKWYDSIGPFGVDFEAPLFRFPGLEVRSVKELKGGHLKLDIWDLKKGVLRQGLWFSPPPTHPVLQIKKLENLEVEVLAEPQWNFFAGRKTLQLLLRDVRVVES